VLYGVVICTPLGPGAHVQLGQRLIKSLHEFAFRPNLYGQIPTPARLRKLGAFHGIFFGHDDRKLIGKLQILLTEYMVVSKRVRLRLNPHFGNTAKEPLRITNPRYRMARTTRPTPPTLNDRQRSTRLQREGKLLPRLPSLPVWLTSLNGNQVDLIEALRLFAQRARRQQPAITQAALAIDDCNLNSALHPVVLQSIITDHDVTVRLQMCGCHCRWPIGADIYWYTGAPRE
jgi:hypothetical protein